MEKACEKKSLTLEFISVPLKWDTNERDWIIIENILKWELMLRFLHQQKAKL